MDAPGLLPEASSRSLSPRVWLLVLAGAAFSVPLALALAQLAAVRRERDHAQARLQELEPLLKKPAPATSPAGGEVAGARIRELDDRLSRLEEWRNAAAPEPALPPRRDPEARAAHSRERALEAIHAGTVEFRAGRYDRAERLFYRAVPESAVYLLLSSLVRGDWSSAVRFLGWALESDPSWLKRVHPRDLFGAAEELEKLLVALEARRQENPLDVDTKLLLAYLYYHQRGSELARAVLSEIDPAHAEARNFMESLNR